MNRRILGTLLLAAGLAVGAGTAGAAATFGIGVYGGASFPIVQDDTGSGAQFGFRVPVVLSGLVSVEPYYASSSLGEVEESFGTPQTYTREGFDVTSYGVLVALGRTVGATGYSFYPFAGVGSNKLERTASEEIKETGYVFGVGLGVGMPSGFGIHLRGQLNMVKTGDTSRKFADATLGLHYALNRAR